MYVASDKPIMSMACNFDTRVVAVGTELQNHSASIHLWDVRNTPVSQAAHYQDVHSDDVTTLSFSSSSPHHLLSGSTDGLVNLYDTRVADEDEVTLQTCNHNASIHRAAFVGSNNDVVLALSHDEQFALYDVAEETRDASTSDAAAMVEFGDLRQVLGCQYVADVMPKSDGSGAIVGAGAQEYVVLHFHLSLSLL